MIEELVKRLQEKKLTEQEEEKLLKEIEETKKTIVANQFARRLEQEKLKMLNQDEDKVRMINLIDEEIEKRRNKNRRLKKIWNIVAIVATFIAVGSAMGLAVLSALINIPFVMQVLVPVLGALVPIGVTYPIAKILSKKSNVNNKEIAKLTKEKEVIIDDVKVDVDNIIVSNIEFVKLSKSNNLKNEINIENNQDLIP